MITQRNQAMQSKLDISKLFDLSGRVAIVTGGAGILGQHFCKGLINYGAKVVIADINFDAANDFAQELSKEIQADVLPVGVDVSDEFSVNEMINKTIEKYGKIDILHNNAATKSGNLEKFFEKVEDYDMNIWREVMQVNIDGMFLVAKTVGKQMLKQKVGGSIVQTASIYGLMSPDQRIYEGSEYMGIPINTPAVYTASKSAVLGITRHLSTYWASDGIRVNSITPGGVESGQNETFTQNYSERIPMGRMARAEEMVGALIYLASDASTYVTGQNISVDGGLSIW